MYNKTDYKKVTLFIFKAYYIVGASRGILMKNCETLIIGAVLGAIAATAILKRCNGEPLLPPCGCPCPCRPKEKPKKKPCLECYYKEYCK